MHLNTEVFSIGAVARVPYSPENAEALTYEDRYNEKVKLYRHEEGANWMLVPRGVVVPGKNTVDGRVTNYLGAINCAVGPMKEDNAQCLAQSLNLLKAGTDHIAEAPTGWGKTYHGCAVAAGLGQTTLIVVTKNDLVAGWHSTLIKLIGVPPDQIGHVQQQKCDYKGKRFVVAMVHSLIERSYDPEFYRYFGLVIFDEVHRLGADYFEQVCGLFPAKHRLGLSATPNRKDGRLRSFQAHIGPVLVRGTQIPMSPKVLKKHTGWKVPRYPKRNPETGKTEIVEMAVNPGQMGAVLKRLCGDPVRNQQIAEFVVEAYKAGRRTLILSDLIDGHLKKLFHAIAKAGVPGQDMDFYIGGRKQADLDVAKNARVVLATFAFTSEGTNVPQWDTLVLGTPKADVEQAVGRILRFVEGKKTPIVLDLVDDHPTLKAFFYSRMKNYYKVKAAVVEV